MHDSNCYCSIVSARTHIRTHTHAHTRTHTHARICTHAYTHTHTRTHARTHAHAPARTHTHVHTHTRNPLHHTSLTMATIYKYAAKEKNGGKNVFYIVTFRQLFVRLALYVMSLLKTIQIRNVHDIDVLYTCISVSTQNTGWLRG